jgi:hypothetical protein
VLREGVKLDKQDLGFENQYRDLGLRQGGEEQDLWYDVSSQDQWSMANRLRSLVRALLH